MLSEALFRCVVAREVLVCINDRIEDHDKIFLMTGRLSTKK